MRFISFEPGVIEEIESPCDSMTKNPCNGPLNAN